MKVLARIALISMLLTMFCTAQAPETRQLDEVTALKLQNIQLQVALLQKNAQEVIDAYMKANKLDPNEWSIDLQKMVISKKAPEKK
jgi:hypothetical protein